MPSWLVEAAHRLLVGLVPEAEQQEQEQEQGQELQQEQEQEEQQEQEKEKEQKQEQQDRGKERWWQVQSARSARAEPYSSQKITNLKYIKVKYEKRKPPSEEGGRGAGGRKRKEKGHALAGIGLLSNDHGTSTYCCRALRRSTLLSIRKGGFCEQASNVTPV